VVVVIGFEIKDGQPRRHDEPVHPFKLLEPVMSKLSQQNWSPTPASGVGRPFEASNAI